MHAEGCEWLVGHLRRRGILDDGPAVVEMLAGGVSNDVLAVSAPGVQVVVKRALRRLRVTEEWLADPDRLLAEAAALRAIAAIQPSIVPPVVDIDADSSVLVIGRAEPGASMWKDALLGGDIDLGVAGWLGEVLARWQMATADDASAAHRFGSLRAFRQLRIEPFFDVVGRRHPQLAETVTELAAGLLATRRCLVHGDFSPKNVLVGPSSRWIIDWEVAHYGDPAFDQAFLLTHLLCKALHRPGSAGAYRRATARFFERYRAGIDEVALPCDGRRLVALTACLVLARIDGTSPADYLSDEARGRGRHLASTTLADPSASVDDIWRMLT